MKTAHELLKAFVCAGLAVLLIQTAAAQTTGTYDHFAHQRIEVERYVIQTYEHYIQRYPSLMGDHAWTGKQEDAQYDQNTFRMVYAWGLTGTSGIPTNATITNVRLYLQGTLTSNAPPNNPPTIDFQVRDFPPSSLTASADQKWTAINNAQTFATWSLQRSTGTFNTYIDYPQGSALANAVQSRLGGTFAIAMKAVDESWAQGAPTIHVVDFKQAPSVDPSSAVRIVVTYTVPANNPVPTITSISPNSAMEGGPAFTLTVYGTNFISSSVVRWNGSDRTTTFISGTEVRASISANDIASPGSASVTVYNPPPGGGTSNPATFTITAASVNVTVRQFLADGSTEVGTLGRWNGSSFEPRLPAPQQYTFQIPSTETLHGDTLIYSNQKHRIWKKLFVEEPNVINHHTFSITQGFPRSLTSQFAETKNDVIIKTDLIDLPGTTGGDIEFRDPWYIDYNDPNYANAPRNRGQDGAVLYRRSVGTTGFKPDYSTPYDGGRTYKGVFLNQGLTPQGQWVPPYYSVGAPNPNTIGGFESYFVNWTGHPDSVGYQNANAQQTGVVFKTSNATAVAKYKAHLASSSTQVTAFNTQRKMVRDRYGAYHMVYESAKQIWYTRSSNEGATWSPEVNITGLWAAPGAINRWPCLAYIPDAAGRADYDRLLVVWEAFDESYPSGRYIVVCELDIYGMLRTAPTDIDYWDAPGPSYPPVAGVITDGNRYGGFYYALVVWYDGARASLMGKVRLQQDNWSSPSSDLRPGVTDYSLASLTLRRDGPAVFEVDTLWHLAYVQENNLMYASIRLNAMGYPEIRRTETVVMGYDGVYIRTPSVAVNNADVCVTWAEDYWEFVTGAVRFSERIAQDKWSNPVGWFPTGGYYRNPVIAADNLHDRITLVWEDDGNRSLYVQRGGGGADWGSVSVLGAGLEPSLAAGMPGVVGELAAARIGGTLHRVSVYPVSFPDDMRMKLTSAGVEGRGGRIKFSHGLLHVGVLSAGREGEPVAFARLSDTARVGSLGQLERRLVSEPFAGTGTLQVRILFASTGQVPSGATLALVLRDAQTNDLLNVLARVSAGTDTLVSIAAPLTYGTRSVELAVAATNCGRPRGYELERWFEASETSASSRLARTTGEGQMLTRLPATFALHPNHPNPFNPTTTIRYDLPEDSHVSLIIYDVLGRKVAEVINEVQGAGFKSVTWDASAVASGVYLARFTARDENGSVKLSKTMKLVLAK